ncbi:serine endopeptidase [Chryseobacterium nematophagum]|uniref:Serine endopeptidase n=2 Tax=Chryseobacterium nematophagum TaxID=2305228 RepID=A0A3M7LDB4_9FLAO|nr:serine endopeptidase [Chryseobacterium nematophagum]
MMKKNSGKKPFFASLLEKQIQEPKNITGGSGSLSTASPTDAESSKLLNSITRPGSDHVTLKYPSDGDEDVNVM